MRAQVKSHPHFKDRYDLFTVDQRKAFAGDVFIITPTSRDFRQSVPSARNDSTNSNAEGMRVSNAGTRRAKSC